MENKTVYLFLADGFEEIEALTPVDLLRRAGVPVVTVGVTGKTVTGAHGIAVTADVTADEAQRMLADGDTPAMVILSGGMPGASNLDASPLVDTFLAAAVEADAYIAAICAAPMILGKRGLLNGKAAVCYPGFEEFLTGARLQEKGCNCAWDGKIITAKGMGAAIEFGLAIVAELKDTATADELAKAIMFK